MGVRVLYDQLSEIAALYCSTTGTAFGELFHDTGKPHFIDAQVMAEQFLKWLPLDARRYADGELSGLQAKFVEVVQDRGAFWDNDDDTDETTERKETNG